jgi:hypothetical protein
MILSNSTPQKREIIPSGSYPARCISMIDIGSIPTEWQGEKKMRALIRLKFELPTVTKVFNPDKGEQPFVIERQFTKSLHEKSALRPFLDNWRGKALTDEECQAFDLSNLLGASCLLSVVHNSVGDRTYANIGGISTLPEGLQCPAQFNHSFIWDYVDNYNEDAVTSENTFIPSWLQETIKSSSEWRMKNGVNEDDFVSDDNINNEEPNDLPF